MKLRNTRFQRCNLLHTHTAPPTLVFLALFFALFRTPRKKSAATLRSLRFSPPHRLLRRNDDVRPTTTQQRRVAMQSCFQTKPATYIVPFTCDYEVRLRPTMSPCIDTLFSYSCGAYADVGPVEFIQHDTSIECVIEMLIGWCTARIRLVVGRRMGPLFFEEDIKNRTVSPTLGRLIYRRERLIKWELRVGCRN
ncbi:hypothetical protein Zmor_013389 [Zophobas morio]|uniref:Uncharacterized protein n=1 Tax=Zophobas morio TaxID=2755281 RepID=A0AA38ID10_9CUCU|nr:hypothetical protein Zmor_013389 [Zophobas morio]